MNGQQQDLESATNQEIWQLSRSVEPRGMPGRLSRSVRGHLLIDGSVSAEGSILNTWSSIASLAVFYDGHGRLISVYW